MLSSPNNYLFPKNNKPRKDKFEFSQLPSPSRFQPKDSIILPPLSKDTDFKNFWATFLRYFNREVELDLPLVKARQALEEYQVNEALLSLERIDVSRLAPFSQAIYYCLKGQTEMLLKDYDAEIEAFRHAIFVLEIGEPLTSFQIMWVRNWIGLALYEQGKITQSLEELNLCLKGNSPQRIYDDRRLRIKVLLNLGHILLSRGENDLALDNYGQALSLVQIKGDKEKIELAGVYWGLGLAYRGKENFSQSKLFLKKSLALFLDIEAVDFTKVARIHNLLGLVMLEREEFKEAEQTLRKAIVLAETLQCPKKDYLVLTSASANLAFLFKLQERWAVAQHWGTLSLGYAEKLTLSHPLLISHAQVELAEINLVLGRPTEAIELFNVAIATVEQYNKVKGCWQIYYRYGTALRHMGQLQEAFDILSKGYVLT